MSKKVASPKQTSGEGFSFENKVATYYAVKMLLADKAFEADKGQIKRIDFQVRAKGWYLDDILLTLRQNGNETQVALSVKSNIQFNKKSAPSDFIEAVWEQILHKRSDVFKTDSDMMGLVTACHPIDIKNAIQEILKFAKSHDPQELEQTLKVKGYISEEVRSLFSSFKCPNTLVGSNTNNLSPADVLKHLYVIEFDFESDVSNNESISISDCLNLLRSGSTQEATILWHSMLEIVNAIRVKGGYIDRNVLAKKLKYLYDLKDFPDYTGDWQSLRGWSSQSIEAIRDKIGGTLNLQRSKQKKGLSEKLDKTKTLALLGTSGIGKTALAKLLAQDLNQSNTIIWLSADDLKKGIISSPNQITGIKHSLIELISNFTSPKGVIILDRIERLKGESDLQELRKLINAIYLDDAWKLLVTCRTEHWQRIQGELLGFINLNDLDTHSVEYLDEDELKLVFGTFPQIRQLAQRAQLGQLIKVPKIIDLIATRIQSKESVAEIKWVGETDLINWLWESIKLSCDDGYPMIVFMQKLAERQADESDFATSITNYKPDEISYLPSLKNEGICTEQDGRISFQHDLYADWSRYKNILANEPNLDSYLGLRTLNPFWHKAIRLYGLYLIEQKSDINEWCNAINRHDSIKDHLLDSVIFAINSFSLLEKIFPLLIASRGELLGRLLKRFLIIATFPNPSQVSFANKYGKNYLPLARTVDRIPLWTYWPDIIMYLHKHLSEFIELVPSEIAMISKTWLRWTPSDYPLRKETAWMALSVGNATYDKRKSYPYSTKDEQDKIRYSAALSAANEFPDEVAELSLKACGRIVPDDVANGKVGDYKKPGSKTTIHHSGFSLPAEVPEPWPDGPINRVDDAFQKICLSSDSLFPLMVKRPKAVEEIILALIIDLRKPKKGYDDYHWSDDHIELQYLHDVFYPGGWHKGPFLNFLRLNLEFGMETIIRLVDFATERVIEVRGAQNNPPVELIIDNKAKHFLGDRRIYNWHRGEPLCSDVVISALMALEKFLYECLDKKQDIREILKKILFQSKSVAFLCLLCEIGKYKPDLFIDVLNPLLAVPEFYSWQDYSLIQGSSNVIRYTLELPEVRKVMDEWEKMPHRNLMLTDIAAHLFVNIESLEKHFQSIKHKFEERLKANIGDERTLEKTKSLIPLFDKNNWRAVKLPKGDAWQYSPPEQLRIEAESTLAEVTLKQNILVFPLRCRQLLDKQEKLSEDNIELFWQQVQKLNEDLIKCKDKEDHIRIIDGIAGGIAVLVKNHFDWLNAHPEYKKWCIKQLFEIIKYPPPKEQFDLPWTVGNTYWDCFISEIAPILWAENPTLKQWREMISALICLRHYSSIQLLMKSAFQLRAILGKSFYQLVSLILLHATVGNPLQHYYDVHIKERRKTYQIMIKMLKIYKKQFINNSLGCDISSWATEALNKAELISYIPHKRGISLKLLVKGKEDIENVHSYRKRPDIDLELISHAFNGIYSAKDAQDMTELNLWLQFWEQALKCRLAFIQCFDDKGDTVNVDEYESDPGYDSDINLLQQIAQFIVELKNIGRSKVLWKPIMELGPSGHYFIETFISWLFVFGLEDDLIKDFPAVLKEILDYFNSSNLWHLNKTSNQGHHIEEIWQCLLGINPKININFNEKYKELIKELKNYYNQWAKENLARDAYSTIYFSEWLKKPIAVLIRLEGISWINEAAQKANEWWWNTNSLIGCLAELLAFSWDIHKSELAGNKEADLAFKQLLQLLVDKQHPVAIDLQNQIAKQTN